MYWASVIVSTNIMPRMAKQEAMNEMVMSSPHTFSSLCNNNKKKLEE